MAVEGLELDCIPGIVPVENEWLHGGSYLARRSTLPRGAASTNALRVVDLFSGIGGFYLGLEHAGARNGRPVEDVFASDINEAAARTYTANYKTNALIDITAVSPEEIPDHDILTAGFPCQPFSNSGLKLGFRDHRGGLFFDAYNIIKSKHPGAFILENVPGLVSSGAKDGGRTPSRLHPGRMIGPTFARMESELFSLHDYRVSWEILNSADFGSPQVRRRIFIVGIRKDLSGHSFRFPKGNDIRNPIATVCESVVLPEYELNAKALDNILSDYRTKRDRLHANGDGMIRVGQAYHCEGGNVGQCYSVYGTSPVLTAIWARFFPVMWEDGPWEAPYVRRVTPREALRLQGFPDDFAPGAVEAATYKQAGNAVNVNVVTAIGLSLLQQAKL